MTGILAYGSLINPREYSGQEIVHAVPVTVAGFKRIFNQLPSWRRGSGNRIAVLNVEPAPRHSINAVCLCFDVEDRSRFNERECGYTAHAVHPARITCHPDFRLPKVTGFYIFVGKEGRQDADILPNDDYLEICINGAKAWGEPFYLEFVATTRLANDAPLMDHLR